MINQATAHADPANPQNAATGSTPDLEAPLPPPPPHPHPDPHSLGFE